MHHLTLNAPHLLLYSYGLLIRRLLLLQCYLNVTLKKIRIQRCGKGSCYGVKLNRDVLEESGSLSITNLFCEWQRPSKSKCDTAFYTTSINCSTTSPFNSSGTYNICFIIGTLVIVSIIILSNKLCGYIYMYTLYVYTCI